MIEPILLDMPVPGAMGSVVRVTARFPDWIAGAVPPVISKSPERNEWESKGKLSAIPDIMLLSLLCAQAKAPQDNTSEASPGSSTPSVGSSSTQA
jgi:hypothetical protein